MRVAVLLVCMLGARAARADTPPVLGQVTKVVRVHGRTLITIDKGSEAGIDTTFVGCLLRIDNSCAAATSIETIAKRRTVVAVTLEASKVSKNGFVRLAAPPPPPPPPPVIATITTIERIDNKDESFVTVDKGSTDGIDRTYFGCVLASDGTCAANAILIRITKWEAVLRVALPPYQLDAHGTARLYRP